MNKGQGADAIWVRAVVSNVFKEKGKVPRVLAYIQGGSPSVKKDVTFRLDQWQGEGDPESRQVVELRNVRLFVGGWRAQLARPVVLEE